MTCLNDKGAAETHRLAVELGADLGNRVVAVGKEHNLCPGCAFKLALIGIFGAMADTGFGPVDTAMLSSRAIQQIDWNMAEQLHARRPS